MNANQGNGMVIQTEDLFLRKENDAASKIGHHLSITALYKKGAVIGNRFDPRLNEKQQWIKKINSGSLIIGLGQQGSFDSFCQYADSLCTSITDDFLPERYVTLSVYDRFLTPLIRSSYDAGKPMALDLAYVDLKKSKIKMVRFNGDTAVYSGFGVLGGYAYVRANTFPVIDVKDKTDEQISAMAEKIIESNTKFPVKEAVRKMESYFEEKAHLDTMEDAMDAVKSTLFECDPPSKKEMFEFTVFEGGELLSTYAERPKAVVRKVEVTG